MERLKKCLSDKEVECIDEIKSDLIKLGFEPTSKCLSYLTGCIFYAVMDERKLGKMTSVLLPEVALVYNVKTISLQNTCRHRMDEVYYNTAFKKLNEVVGFDYIRPYEKPSLNNFISTLAQKYILKYHTSIPFNKEEDNSISI